MRRLRLVFLVCLAAFVASLYGQEKQFGLGHTPTAEEMQSWKPTVLADGTGLPAGSGTPAQGEKVYRDKCSGCHGDHGQGNKKPLGTQLVGGFGTLKSVNPILTIGSYWPYATTVWDYIYRAMPYPQPGTLSANETYALTAYLLSLNNIIRPDEVMNRETLPKIRMPNRNGFVPDPRPDVACPTNNKGPNDNTSGVRGISSGSR